MDEQEKKVNLINYLFYKSNEYLRQTLKDLRNFTKNNEITKLFNLVGNDNPYTGLDDSVLINKVIEVTIINRILEDKF
jgi:hypothetical protein